MDKTNRTEERGRFCRFNPFVFSNNNNIIKEEGIEAGGRTAGRQERERKKERSS